ncbi:unnamed protein product [Rhizophagus irregularis]|nr:unnamed protein product [Rhizophagus irregularis]
MCGKTGHLSRNCSRSGGYGGGGAKCYNCGKTGHMAKNCNSNSSNSKKCYSCGEHGHPSDDCDKEPKCYKLWSSRVIKVEIVIYHQILKFAIIVNRKGHIKRDCTLSNVDA